MATKMLAPANHAKLHRHANRSRASESGAETFLARASVSRVAGAAQYGDENGEDSGNPGERGNDQIVHLAEAMFPEAPA